MLANFDELIIPNYSGISARGGSKANKKRRSIKTRTRKLKRSNKSRTRRTYR
jgi:hypothetical protein